MLVRELIDLFIRGQHDAQTYTQAIYVLAWIGFVLGGHVAARLVADYAITHVNPFVLRDIECHCFQVLIQRSYRFFSEVQTGALVAKIRRYADAYEAMSFNFTRGIYCILLQFIFSSAVIFCISPLLACIVLIWGAIFIAIDQRLIAWKMKHDIERSKVESKAMGLMADSIGNFLAVKVFSKAASETAGLRVATSESALALRRSWLASTAINFVEGLLMAAVQAIVFIMAFRLWRSGEISVGTIVLLQTYIVAICALLSDFGNYSKAIFRNLAAAQEMSDMLAEPADVGDVASPEPCRIKQGSIEFKNVTFGYASNAAVLRDFNLHVYAGERIGLVGSSGAGKSTIVKLLLRFLDTQSGSIEIDGQNIALLKQDDLRRSIAFVPQEALLFHRSIGENIAYGGENVSAADIREAARQAYILDFIESLPQGFNTLVGERGIKLSGGEKQRIAIARAMLRRAPILVLDEATNALDSVSEKYVQLAFENLMRSRTCIVIAHRLSSVQLMDRILVLSHGQIVQEGQHNDLMLIDGPYQRFWREQERSENVSACAALSELA